jgi:hypothetical protein
MTPRITIDHKLISPEPNSGCWIWTGYLNKGYGHVVRGGYGRGPIQRWRVHRLSYETACGPIPVGLELDHLCRVRCCVNPDHLEPVTRLENIRRGEAGSNNRSKTHCPKGHPYSEENTVLYSRGRECRTCRSRSAEAYYQKRKLARAQS